MDTSKTYKKSISNPLEPDFVIERVKWCEDPVYIKMCDCEEIQKGWKAQVGDNYNYPKESPAIHTVLNSDMPTNKYDIAIWLPRQDQLQGMVYESYKMDVTDSPYLRNLTMLRDIHEFTQMNRKNNISQLVSMEQLWLAFVMKEKYSKIWDGEKWI